MVEMVEISHGVIKPTAGGNDEDKKFIAMMFMEGADKKQFSYLLKDLETDYSLGKKEVYPGTIEDALQVLAMHSEKALKRKKLQEEKKQDGNAAEFNFAQAKKFKCWLCGSEEHLKIDCPLCKGKGKAHGQAFSQTLNSHTF